MGLRDRLRRVERVAPTGAARSGLPDGTEIRYGYEEMLGALCTAIDEREHRLLPYLRQMPSEVREGMPGLIRAIEGDAGGA